MMMIYKLPFLKIEILVPEHKYRYNKLGHKCARSIDITVREINTYNTLFVLNFDERENSMSKYLDIDILPNYKNKVPTGIKDRDIIFKKLLTSFERLKSSDFRYGNKNSDISDCTKKIFIEDFINFLIVDNRDKIINKILIVK